MKTPRPTFVLTCSIATLLTAAAAQSVHAQAANADIFTNAAGDNNWNNPANWSTGALPSGTDAVVNTTAAGGVTAVYGADAGSTQVDIFAGDQGGTGRIDVTGGTLSNGNSNWTFVGVTNGTGVLNVANTATTGGTFTGYGTGTGSLAVGGNVVGNGRLWIGGDQNATDGNIGTGTMNVNTTGTVTVGNDIYLAPNGTGGKATLNMDAGTFTQTGGWTFVGGDRAGDNGAASTGGTTGIINQSGGTINMSGDVYFGRGNGSTGTFNMTGGTYTQGGTMDLGQNGAGTGTVTQSGAGSSVTIGNELQIGNTTSNNSYTLNAGSVTVNSWVAIGRFNGNGTLNINGGTFTKNNSNSGFFDVSSGNTQSTSTGVVNLNGGVLVVPKVIDEVGATGSGVFNFNGGILRANSDGTQAFNNNDVNPGFFQGLTTANVRNGGASFDTNGFNITVAQSLTHSNIAGDAATDGGLSKVQGTGTLTLTGVNTYTGPTVVSVGTLALGINASTAVAGSIANTSSIQVASGAFFDTTATGVAFTVPAAATLTGTGTVTTGANALTVNGILAPGVTSAAGSYGTLTLNTTGALTLEGTTQFDLAGANNKDLITTTGPASLTLGGTLALQSTPAGLTGTFALINGLNAAPTGSFANVTGVPANERATFSYAGGTYSITLAAVPEPSTWALGVFGLGMTALWLRRRRVA